MYVYSDGVFLCNSLHNVGKCIPIGLAMSLSPQKFIEAAGKLMGMAPFHPLQLRFDSIPITFDVLGMNTCDGIHKMP